MAQVETLPNARKDRTEERMVSTKRLKYAPWNPNTMNEDERKAMRAEMVDAGPSRTAPIDIIPEGLLQTPRVMNLPEDTPYVVMDGNQRAIIAIEDLKWPEVRAIIHYDKNKQEAMLLTYQRDYGRGTFDPYKEGAFFKTLADEGKLTLEQLSQKLAERGINFSISALSRKIAIANLDPEVKKKASGETALPGSALEVVATVQDPELQKKVLDEVEKEGKKLGPGEKVPVRTVEKITKEVKQVDVAQKSFDALLAKAKFKTCPTDKSAPVFDPTHDYGKDPKPLFRCNSVSGWWEHKWDPMTGEQPNMPKHIEPEPGAAADTPEKKPPPPPFPDYIRTTHTVEELRLAATALLKGFIVGVDEIEEVRLTGKTADGTPATFFLNREYVSGDVTVETKGGTIPAMLFRMEPKKYKEDALKEYRAIVRAGGTIKNSEQASRVEQDFEAFLKKWLPPGRASPPPQSKSKDEGKKKEPTLDAPSKGAEKSKKTVKRKKGK